VSRASFVRRAIQEMVASTRHRASRVDSLEVSPETAEAFREKTSKPAEYEWKDLPPATVGGAEAKPHPAIRAEAAPARRTQTKVAEVLRDPGIELLQFRCGVCGLKTIGGPCVKHPKHSEVIA
jgi:rubrerythrin